MSQVTASMVTAAAAIIAANPEVPALVTSALNQIKKAAGSAASVTLDVVPGPVEGDGNEYNVSVAWKNGVDFEDLIDFGTFLRTKNGLMDSSPKIEYLPKQKAVGCIVGIYPD